MQNVMKMAEGKKTYAVVICMIALLAAESFGWITSEQSSNYIEYLMAGGLYTLYDKVKRIGDGQLKAESE